MNFFWFFYHDDVTTMGPEPLSVIDPASDNDRARSRVTVTVTVTHNRVKHMAHDDDRPSPLSTAIFTHKNIRIQAPSITFHAARSASRWSAGVSQNEIPSLGFPVPTVY